MKWNLAYRWMIISVGVSLLLVLFAFGQKHFCFADEANIGSVEIISSQKIVGAYGLILVNPVGQAADDNKPQMFQRAADVRETGEGTYQIVVRLAPGDYRPQANMSVIAVDESGRTISTSVRSLDPTATVKDMTPAICVPENIVRRVNNMTLLKEEDLNKILEVRKQKRAVLNSLVESLLNPEVTAQLQQKEWELGLNYNDPLSLDLPREELAYRLAAIQALSRVR